MHLSAIDLNLLVVLHELLETHSVKEAAKRLSLSRSATSHALGRLRDLLADPLLVRAGRELTPTLRAEQLRLPLHRLLEDTQRLLSASSAFEPRTVTRSFSIGTNDYSERVLLVPLSGRVSHAAPGIDIYSSRARRSADELRSGTVDLVFAVQATSPADILSEPLYRERYVCMMRPGHPALEEPLTPDRYADLHHVVVAPGGTPSGIVDRRLDALGLRRRVARTVATFGIAPHLIPGSDYILTMAERVARPMAMALDLVVVVAPVDVQFSIEMRWHQRSAEDPAHAWLQAQIRALAAEMRPTGSEEDEPQTGSGN